MAAIQAQSRRWIQHVAKRDYYDVLGVPRTASAEEIRKAFKKLARKFHPDVKPQDPDAEKKFAEITEAYEVIGDEDKRKKYDQFGHAFEGAGGSPFSGFGGQGEAAFDLNDILGGMFGGGFRGAPGGGPGGGFGTRRGAPRARRGDDVTAEIIVPFQVAAIGGEHELTVRTASRDERLNLKIPAGLESGRTLRLSGQGNPGANGGKPGDLLVTVRVAPHPWFKRDGLNLLLEVPLTPSEAALGAKVDIPTLAEGTVVLTVPPGSSGGSRLRLRQRGIADAKTGARGDQIVILRIVIPPGLSPQERQLYEQLAAENPFNPRSTLWH